MASIVIAGDVSGSVTLQAPSASGSTVLTLPTTSGTIVTTAGGSTVPFAAGSASTPSITFTGDTNTGIFSPAADTIAFTEGGVESMRIDSSGNVGIGTSSPLSKLDVKMGTNLHIITSGVSAYGSNAIVGVTDAGSETNLGLAGDTVRFYTAATERMRLDSSGMLGLGITPAQTSGIAIELGGSASNNAINFLNSSNVQGWITSNAYYNGTNWLRKYGGGTTCTAYATNVQGCHVWNYAAASTAGSTISWSEAMRIDSSGNLLVGGTNPNQTAQVLYATTGGQGSTYVKAQAIGVAGTSGTAFDGAYRWYTSTSNGSAFRNGFSLQLRSYDTGQNAETTIATAINTAWYQGNNSSTWSTTSDERLKTNIRPISKALDKICALNPCHFEMVNEPGETKTNFIAQEFEQVFSGHVKEIPTPEEFKEYTDSRTIKTIDPNLIPYLTAAIKEQQAIINDLKTRIEQLEAK